MNTISYPAADWEPISAEDAAKYAANQRKKQVARAMENLTKTIHESFPEELRPLKAALAVAAVKCLEDSSQPIALVFVGPSSAGKTLSLSFLMPTAAEDASDPYFYRTDHFTVHSFVSHKADVNEEELREKIDMLPKIKDKTMITKELAPTFRGKEAELIERFAVLTSVLDGSGFSSDSGAHGKRGYPEPINFQWLGATTPLSNEALSIIANLGTRMFFYSLERERRDTEALAALAGDSENEAKKGRARSAVQKFIEVFFECVPPRSVRTAEIGFSKPRLRRLALLSQVTAALRTMKSKSGSPVEMEYPERALFMLKEIAIGSALVHGRREINDEDMDMTEHIASSSGPWTRQKVFRALLRLGGSATTTRLVEATGLSKPTALAAMKELDSLGLATFAASKGDFPATLELVRKFEELIPARSESEKVGRKAKGSGGGKGERSYAAN